MNTNFSLNQIENASFRFWMNDEKTFSKMDKTKNVFDAQTF